LHTTNDIFVLYVFAAPIKTRVQSDSQTVFKIVLKEFKPVRFVINVVISTTLHIYSSLVSICDYYFLGCLLWCKGTSVLLLVEMTTLITRFQTDGFRASPRHARYPAGAGVGSRAHTHLHPGQLPRLPGGAPRITCLHSTSRKRLLNSSCIKDVSVIEIYKSDETRVDTVEAENAG
jgi:hypothetical protein